MAQVSFSTCTNCENVGRFFCYDCKKTLCELCKPIHNKFTSGHTLTQLQNVSKVELNAETTCLIHEQKSSFYCLNILCKSLICDECAVGSHKSHELETIKDHSTKLRDKMKKLVTEFRSAEKSISKLFNDIEKNDFILSRENDFYLSEVKTTADELIKIIKIKTDDVVSDIEDKTATERNNLKCQMSALQKLQSEFSSRSKELEQSLDIKHDATFLAIQELVPKDQPNSSDIPVQLPTPSLSPFEDGKFIKELIELFHKTYQICCLEKDHPEKSRLESDVKVETEHGKIDRTRKKIKSVKSLLESPSAGFYCQQKRYLLSAAIHFGSTVSGLSYSFITDYNRNPMRWFTYLWANDGGLSEDVPTVLLLNKHQDYVAFGYDAENKYSEYGDHYGFYMFRNFDIMHEPEPLTPYAMMKDDSGDMTVSAIKIFCMIIKTIKEEFLRAQCLDNNEVLWVIPVPISWTELTKQFLRVAAYMAGIKDEQLLICLDHESALLYNQRWSNCYDDSTSSEICTIRFESIASKDIRIRLTVSLVDDNGTLWELKEPNSVSLGCVHLHEGVYKLFSDLLGDTSWRRFLHEHEADRLHLHQILDTKHKYISSYEKGNVTIRPPSTLQRILMEDTGQTFTDVIVPMPFTDNVKWMGDRLRMKTTYFRSMYNEPINSLITHAKLFLSGRNFKTILLVGKYADYYLLKKAIENAFPEKIVLVPDGAYLAVQKGAVVYGHKY